MRWIEKVRQLPQPQKLKIIWAVAIAVLVLMLVIWVLASKIQKNTAADTSLFQAIGQGFNNIRKNYGK